ncbi:MAG: META domain-containing protein [Flavobacteriales bacterium]|nr:META domain-containing protein [Flavobacteriales bacterium]
MKKLHLSLSALAIGVILSANTCSDRENGMAGENLDMIKGKWELQSLEGTPVKMPAGIEQPYLSIDSTGKNLSGYGGCNRIFGEFKVSNDSISFPGLAATRMYCEATQKIEDGFLKALNTTRTYTLKKDELVLMGGKELAVLRRISK